MTKKALVLIANGTEEMEAVITIDVLRRAKVDVTVAAVDSDHHVTCSRGVYIVPDTPLAAVTNFKAFDLVVVPGGLKGAETMAADARVLKIVQEHHARDGIVAAICAGPLVLQAAGFKGVAITSYPSFKDKLGADFDYKDDKRVVVDGKFITSRGPGTAMEFALILVEQLTGPTTMRQVAGPMLVPETYRKWD